MTIALSRAQIEDIEGDILDGFRSTPKDDILNGWDATSPQPAEEAKAADDAGGAAAGAAAADDAEAPADDAEAPADDAAAGAADAPAAATPTAAAPPTFGDGTPHGAQLPPIIR